MKSMFRKMSKKDGSLPEGGKPRPAHTQARAHLHHAVPTRRPDRLNNNAPSEPPPAYTAAPEPTSTSTFVDHTQPARAASERSSTIPDYNQSSQAAPGRPQSAVADDAYSFLRTFDTIFVIDDSGSMAGGRWREASDAIATVAPICTSHDHDGIDIYFLNAPESPIHHGVQSAATVREIFETVRPGGGTPTGQRLRSILAPYVRRYELDPERTKPINIICITDGDAHDDVESPLIEAAKKLDALDAPAWQVGVQFFQIGNDPGATELLKYLDDELASNAGGPMRDIVDTVPHKGRDGGTLTADGVLKVVLGSVNRRLDRRRSKDLHRSDA